MAGYDVDIELERLHWVVEIGDRSNVVDLIPGVLGTIAIEVDGRLVGHVRKPAPQRPWLETAIDVAGEPVVVAVIWNNPTMQTDLFVAGRSVRDRRTLEAARAGAPRPLTNYETWIDGLFRYPPRGWRRIGFSRSNAVLGIVSLAALVVLLYLTWRSSGLILGVALVVAMFALFAVWAASWTALAARVHRALLARPDLGESRRLAWFMAALLGYPVLSVAVVVLIYGVARTLATT